MEVVGIVIMAIGFAVIGGFSLRADMSDRFSFTRQKQDQKNSMVLYRVQNRERKLLRWVFALAASAVVLSLMTAASIIGFLAEDAKGYGNANETALELSFFGMIITPILAIMALYHLVGMIVRLRAWRQVLAELPVQGDKFAK